MANSFFTNIVSLFGGTRARANSVEAKSALVEAAFDMVAQQVMGVAVESGTGNNFLLTFTPQPAAWPARGTFVFLATHANTGPATLQIGALATKALLANDGTALASNHIVSGELIAVYYNGTDARIVGATKSYVDSASFSAALPAQAGNAGKFIVTDGGAASWSNTVSALTAGNGTVSAPAISLGDSTSGFFRNALNQISVAVAGALAITVDATRNLLLAANLTFSGTGQRITGLMDGSPHANRVLFQTSTLNANTNLGLIPNGSATQAFFRSYTSSDPDNATFISLQSTATNLGLNIGVQGTGTVLPMTFSISSVEHMRIDTAGNVGIGGPALSGFKLEVTNNVDGAHAVIVRNSNAGVNATSIVQLTNGTKFVNQTVSFNGNFYAISAAGGINTVFSSFDTQIWRNNAGTEYGRIDSVGRKIWGYSAHVSLQASTYLGQFLASGSNFPLAAGYTANTTTGPKLTLAKNRAATWATNVVVVSGDTLGEIDFMGSDGTNIIPGARIGAYVDATPGANDMPGRLVLSTTADGASSPTERMRISAAGDVGVGGTASGARLHAFGATDCIVKAEGLGGYGAFSAHASSGNSAQNFYVIAGVEAARISVAGATGVTTFHQGSGAAERLRIDGAGNVVVTGVGGLGYGTGSGGSVTQLTSRATPVTLNKMNGAITLFSAAGSATEASFTVNNSLVAITDVVLVSVRSGTNRYLTWVTVTANGLFDITFRTTGGTAVDAPVFNFAVIKAVNA